MSPPSVPSRCLLFCFHAGLCTRALSSFGKSVFLSSVLFVLFLLSPHSVPLNKTCVYFTICFLPKILFCEGTWWTWKTWVGSRTDFDFLRRDRSTVLALPSHFQPILWVTEVGREKAGDSFLGATDFLFPISFKSYEDLHWLHKQFYQSFPLGAWLFYVPLNKDQRGWYLDHCLCVEPTLCGWPCVIWPWAPS